jgi:hypothetical protein
MAHAVANQASNELNPWLSPQLSSLRRWHRENTAMKFRYRDYLIFTAASFDSTIGDWTASAHIEFTENLKIHTVVMKSRDGFLSEGEAERFIIKQAKQWVSDNFKSTPVELGRNNIRSKKSNVLDM